MRCWWRHKPKRRISEEDIADLDEPLARRRTEDGNARVVLSEVVEGNGNIALLAVLDHERALMNNVRNEEAKEVRHGRRR